MSTRLKCHPKGAWSAALLLLLACGLRAEEHRLPGTLVQWRDPAYTQRYYLRVDPPGEAGAVDLQREPMAASIVLPLKLIGDPPKPETLLLVGEDGVVQPLLARPAPGGKEVELAFATHPGLRRYCLYAGAPPGAATTASPADFHCDALSVVYRGRSISPELSYTPARPLTLDRFREIEAGMGNLLGIGYAANIDAPENPFFSIKTDTFGHVQRIQNPIRYACLYEAFLRTPVKGRYQFALDTPGMAQMLIDGLPVLGADKPGLERGPFALNNAVELSAGLHRITLYYAEAGQALNRTNMDQRLFGLRLHWQPPGAAGWMCIPAQAFPRALPAEVAGFEKSQAACPCIHLETLGDVRVDAQYGPRWAREYAQVFAKLVGAPAGSRLRVSAPGLDVFSDPSAAHLLQWVPADTDVTVSALSPDGKVVLDRRDVRFPSSKEGARDVLDLEADLSLKAAPDFLYSDETGQIHLETLLDPAPVIVPKERMEGKFFPPPPHPLGQFWLTWAEGSKLLAPVQEATPLEGGRRKLRVPVELDRFDPKALQAGTLELSLRLKLADVPVEDVRFRVLDAQAPTWPGRLEAGAAGLFFEPSAETASTALPDKTESDPELLERNGAEHAILVTTRENERGYRAFAPLKLVADRTDFKTALFLGDPLVENVSSGSAPCGLPERLAKAFGGMQWSNVLVAGPHRYLPVYRLLSRLDAFARAHSQKLPELVVVSLGGGDVARQTPLYSFERALDVLIDRLRVGGAKRVFFAGVLPEPSRERQCAIYQERVSDVLRQHHVDGLDLCTRWIAEPNWARRYALDGGGSAPLYGPDPNGAALDEIARLIQDEL